MAEGFELQAMAGDDPDGAEGKQAAGRAQESAHHGIGYVADGAAHARQAETAKHDAGGDGGDAKRNQNRAEQRRGGIDGRHTLDQRCD